jgi:tRNA 2-selenouridine synthase
MAHVLREIGWPAETLAGGYRAYRRWVVRELETLPQNLSYSVVHGPTGSGKSRLLAALRRAGAQVLDLEGLAAHRGSVLGTLPDRPQPSQKWFESLLLDELAAFDAARTVFVEGESKKIGQLQVPEALIAAMRSSPISLHTRAIGTERSPSASLRVRFFRPASASASRRQKRTSWPCSEKSAAAAYAPLPPPSTAIFIRWRKAR